MVVFIGSESAFVYVVRPEQFSLQENQPKYLEAILHSLQMVIFFLELKCFIK
jgi:hypothetical protein